ncbi:MAG: hypothetical protein MAG715_01289 [Methanonatronarchaeales archaeon]|nr:hypothetical protein [Methanonatronarchaeales archaeon]
MAAVEGRELSPGTRFAKALADAGYSDFYLIGAESARRVLTERRLELIEVLREEEPGSISGLAEVVDRDVAAVHRDLDVLVGQGIVELREEGNRRRPVLRYSHIFVKPVV